MIPFTAPIKIYYFKDENYVSVSFKINESVVLKTGFTESEFDTITSNWNIEDGIQGLYTVDNGKVWWEHRTVGPRPECVDCDHVVVEINDFSFRFETAVMVQLVDEYNFQKNNKMHWD